MGVLRKREDLFTGLPKMNPIQKALLARKQQGEKLQWECSSRKLTADVELYEELIRLRDGGENPSNEMEDCKGSIRMLKLKIATLKSSIKRHDPRYKFPDIRLDEEDYPKAYNELRSILQN